MSRAPRCPRFDSCNAPICPLDPKWPTAQHIKGEPVCAMLSELVKVGGRPRLEGLLSAEQMEALIREWPKVEARWSPIRARLKDAAKSGSRIERGKGIRMGSVSLTHGRPLPDPLGKTPPLDAVPVTEGMSGGAG